MLKAMRDNLKSLAWILWAVILVFVLLVFLDFGAVNPGATGPTVAASMGDYEATWSELERENRRVVDEARAAYGDQFSQIEPQLQLPRQALENVFDRKVLRAEAERLGLMVTDEEIRKEILRLPLFQDERGRFVGKEIYEQETRRQFGGPGAFERQLREDLLLRKLFRVLQESIYITDQEVERAYREDVEQAEIRYLLLPASRFAEEARADQAALESYFQEHRNEFELPEQRVVDYLLVDRGVLRTQMEVSEEDLRAYYESHPEEFAREEQVRARHILLQTGGDRTVAEARSELEAIQARIEAGGDFAAIAREVSDDAASGAQGGDLGYFGRGRMTPEFEEAAFAAETGELVGPVESPFGVHLIEVTDRRPAGSTPYEEAREPVRNRLASERLEEAAAELAQELRRQLDGVPEGGLRARMEALAEEHPAIRFQTSAPFSAGSMVPGLGRSPELDAALGAADEGELAEGVVSTPRGPLVARLAEVREPRTPELSEVEARVRREVETERQRELAEARLTAIRSSLDDGSGLEAAAEDLGVELVASAEIGQDGVIDGLGFAPAVNQAALGAEEGDIVGPIETPQGPVLFEVTERRGFDPQELASRSEELRASLRQERLNRLLSSLILERRRQEGGIQPSRQLMDQLGDGALGNPS